MNQAHTLFRGEKCGLWLNFEGISSYSRGEWPIVLLHRTQRASRIPLSIANGVHTDTATKWPADVFYELWNFVHSAPLLIKGRMSTLFYFCRVTTQWYSGQEFVKDKMTVYVACTCQQHQGPLRRITEQSRLLFVSLSETWEAFSTLWREKRNGCKIHFFKKVHSMCFFDARK